MPEVLAEKWQTARVAHGCRSCGGTIGRGDFYYQQRCADDGTAWTYKSHGLCAAVWHDEWNQYDWDDEVSPDAIRDRLSAIFDAFASLLRGQEKTGP